MSFYSELKEFGPFLTPFWEVKEDLDLETVSDVRLNEQIAVKKTAGFMKKQRPMLRGEQMSSEILLFVFYLWL